MQVHLCARSPCNDPGAAAVHIVCSASVGWTTGYDLQEMAGRGPWCRAWRVAVWASHSLAALGPVLRPCPRRLAPRHRPDVDPNSETDTDTEDKPCQAHLVALSVSGSVVALCEGQCSDSARGGPIALLLEDADRSATSEFGSSRPRYTFEGCPTHRDAYVASRATRACSRVGCPRAKTNVREGIPLCDEHLRPSVTWHDEPPAVPPTRARSPSPGRIAPAAELPEDPGPALSQAWIRWGEPNHLAAQAYFAFSFQLMGPATDSTRRNPQMSVYIPDLDLTFSVPSGLAAGGINAVQAEQMALSRAPVIVDPQWNGKPCHNQHRDPLPYAAAQSLTRGEFPEGYAVHHLGRVLPADEQPQPATPRASSRDPLFPSAELGTPRASADPTAPDLQALGDYVHVSASVRAFRPGRAGLAGPSRYGGPGARGCAPKFISGRRVVSEPPRFAARSGCRRRSFRAPRSSGSPSSPRLTEGRGLTAGSASRSCPRAADLSV